jgi:DNA-binding CsgD family transcriptional regulator
MKGLLSTEKVGKLYIQGCSCADIADIDGRSEATIYNLLKNDDNVVIRSRSEANHLFPDIIFIHLYNLGLSCSQIGEILNIHPTTIIKRFKTIHFPIRSKEMAAKLHYDNDEFTLIKNNPNLFQKEYETVDYFPVLLGKFDSTTKKVTVSVWQEDDDLIQPSLDCYRVLNTSRWGWSLYGMFYDSCRKLHYTMSNENGHVFRGFLLGRR